MKIYNWKDIYNSLIEFGEFVGQNIVYPELDDWEDRFRDVPLEIMIDEKGRLLSAVYQEMKTDLHNSWVHPWQQEYINEALRLAHSFEGWVPKEVEGGYEKTRRIIPIHFHYHRHSLQRDDVVLNPDVRPLCLDTSRRYESIIQGKHGSDGDGMALAIIDEDGWPDHVEAYRIQGKTNDAVIEGDLKSFKNWRPAVYNGQKVKSQVVLRLHNR